MPYPRGVSERALSVSELLHLAGGPKYGSVTPAQLEQFLTGEGLGEVVDAQVVVSDRARELVDMLRPEYRGDGCDAQSGSASPAASTRSSAWMQLASPPRVWKQRLVVTLKGPVPT